MAPGSLVRSGTEMVLTVSAHAQKRFAENGRYRWTWMKADLLALFSQR